MAADELMLTARTVLCRLRSFLGAVSVTWLINLAVFACTLWLLPSLREQLILPLALGSICALFFNYGAMRCYVFPQRAASVLTKDGSKQPA